MGWVRAGDKWSRRAEAAEKMMVEDKSSTFGLEQENRLYETEVGRGCVTAEW